MIPLYITEFQSSPVRTWGTGRGAGRHGGSASPPRGLRRLEGPSSMPDLPSLHRGRHGRSPLCALPLFQRATVLSSALQGQGVRSSPRKVTASRALFQTPRLTAPRPPHRPPVTPASRKRAKRQGPPRTVAEQPAEDGESCAGTACCHALVPGPARVSLVGTGCSGAESLCPTPRQLLRGLAGSPAVLPGVASSPPG